jgi:hypothetical protein
MFAIRCTKYDFDNVLNVYVRGFNMQDMLKHEREPYSSQLLPLHTSTIEDHTDAFRKEL